MWLPDVFDSRGVRTTIRVEPAVAHYARTANRWTTPPLLLAWSDRLRRWFQHEVQRTVLDGRWAVDVESDSGETLRVEVGDRAEAIELGELIRADLEREGVAALDRYR